MTATMFLLAFVIAIIITAVLEGKIMKKVLGKMTVDELLDAVENSWTRVYEGKKYLDELYRRNPEAVQNWAADVTNKPLRDFFLNNIYVVVKTDIDKYSKIVFTTTNKAKADACFSKQKDEFHQWYELIVRKDGEESC